MQKRIYLGADHKGFELKNYLKEKLKSSFEIRDCGAFFFNLKDDYPDFAKKVVEKVAKDKSSFGILLCGSGIGMSIAANRHPKIRAALCLNHVMAKMARKHNNANVLCLPSHLDKKRTLNITKSFLSFDFEEGRHQRRIRKIQKYAQEFSQN